MGGFVAMRWLWGGQRVGLALLGVLFVFSIAAQGKEFILGCDRPLANAARRSRRLAQVLNPSESRAITARGRKALKRSFPIDPQTLSLLRATPCT